MAIRGVGQSYYQNNVATTINVNNTEKIALEKTESTRELSEAEEMELFRKEFYAELERIPKNRTITNLAVNISEEAFKNMSKAFHWGYNKKKSKDAVGLLTSTTTTLFENRTDEIRRKNDQLSKRLDELERKIKEG